MLHGNMSDQNQLCPLCQRPINYAVIMEAGEHITIRRCGCEPPAYLQYITPAVGD